MRPWLARIQATGSEPVSMHVLRAEVLLIIVGRKTMDAEIIEKLAHLFGLTFAPLEIRGVEFDALVSHLGNGTHGAFGVLFERVADRIQFEADRNGGGRSSRERP